jgi:hypothetical protein
VDGELALGNRAEFESALRSLAMPLGARYSPGSARVLLGVSAASFSETCVQMEGYTRPLWGLAPLVAGGGAWADWPRVAMGLANGTDPAHPEYWGPPADADQRLVEIAAIAFALCVAPAALWEPLAPSQRANVLAYLGMANGPTPHDNNWLFFRVFANLALARLGGRADQVCMRKDLDRLESFYKGDGWYLDGAKGRADYYCAFAMHFYGLLYSVLAQREDPERCERFRQRAAEFARQYIHWFGADGSALPYGRSLTYRFAQGAFWGALAYAGVEALPWGVLKGLMLRNLRWWLRQPVLSESGLLTVGYGYPNPIMAEDYNSPASPYWAFKTFLPLALPDEHPFWRAVEAPLPALAPRQALKEPGMIVCRDEASDHVLALAAGPSVRQSTRHDAAKYAKFCYSNRFGFGVPTAVQGLQNSGHDSMLMLSEDGLYFRGREASVRSEIHESCIASEWRPWPDVRVNTWLVPAGAWHVRIHRIQSKRRLLSAEGGFALPVGAGEEPKSRSGCVAEAGHASARREAGTSALRDLLSGRKGEVVNAAPNSNVLWPRTLVPTLVDTPRTGEWWLACTAAAGAGALGDAPSCTDAGNGLVIRAASGAELLRLERVKSKKN